ncbi:unnamed protein product [Ascophyllum nodosum]
MNVYLFREFMGRQAVLIAVCVCSDVLPRASAGFLASRGEIWRALLDNASHACIAAASWAVVVAISPSPAFSSMAAPGSPLHRCASCTILRARGRLRAIGLSLRRLSTADSSISLGRGDLQESPSDGGLGNAPSARDSAASAREIACVACFGSLLDVDHFLAGGSLRLKNAMSLAKRPWGHCLAFLVLATLIASVLTHNKRVAASVLLAGASHQLRDATRRGLWLYAPRGPKTQPLGYPLYLLVQALLPIAVALCLTRSVGSWFRRCPEGEDRGARGRRRCSLFDASQSLHPMGGEEGGDRGSLVEVP